MRTFVRPMEEIQFLPALSTNNVSILGIPEWSSTLNALVRFEACIAVYDERIISTWMPLIIE